MELKQVFRQNKTLFFVTFLGLLSYVIKFVLNAFLIHQLGEVLYGDFSLGFKMLLLVGGVLLMGTAVTSKRFLNEYMDDDTTSALTDYLSWNFRMIQRMTYFFFLAFMVFTLYLFILHYTKIHSIYEYPYTVYFVWFSPLAAITSLLASYFGANQHIIKSILFRDILINLLMLILFFVCVHLMDLKLNALQVLLVIFFSYLLILITELVTMKSTMPRLYRHIPMALFGRNREYKTEWSHLSKRLFISSIFLTLVDISAMIILALFADKQDLGLFSAMMILFGFFWTFNLCMSHFFVPNIAPLVRKGQLSELVLLYQRVMRFKAAIMIPSLIIFILYIHPILAIFSPKLQEIWYYPVILAITSTLVCLISPTTYMLNLMGKELVNLRLNQVEIMLMWLDH